MFDPELVHLPRPSFSFVQNRESNSNSPLTVTPGGPSLKDCILLMQVIKVLHDHCNKGSKDKPIISPSGSRVEAKAQEELSHGFNLLTPDSVTKSPCP